MSKKLLIDVSIISVFAIAGVVYLSIASKEKSNDNSPTVISETVKTPRNQTKPIAKQKSGSVVSIPKNPRDGQFWASGRVNSGHVRFLVDTGASTVALTMQDAQKAGIKTRDLKFNVPISTAGGRNYAAFVKLDSVAIGGITLRDVDAMVVEKGLSVSLLGMTYLGQLQKVEASPNALLLRL